MEGRVSTRKAAPPSLKTESGTASRVALHAQPAAHLAVLYSARAFCPYRALVYSTQQIFTEPQLGVLNMLLRRFIGCSRLRAVGCRNNTRNGKERLFSEYLASVRGGSMRVLANNVCFSTSVLAERSRGGSSALPNRKGSMDNLNVAARCITSSAVGVFTFC